MLLSVKMHGMNNAVFGKMSAAFDMEVLKDKDYP
jgi:hypothetical protein